MLPVIVALLLGAGVGALRRPLGTHVSPLVLRAMPLLVAGIGFHALLALDVALGGFVFTLSLLALLTFAVYNLHLVGMGVVAIGLACNLLVVAANGSMPVRASALVRAGAVPVAELADADLGAGRRFERDSDRLRGLGDVIPSQAFDAALSFGDLIVLFGLGAVAGDIVRYARRRSRWSLASTMAKAAHDWGWAPKPRPVSGSQYSAQPEVSTPDMVLVLTDSATPSAPPNPSPGPDTIAARAEPDTDAPALFDDAAFDDDGVGRSDRELVAASQSK